MIWKERTKSR